MPRSCATLKVAAEWIFEPDELAQMLARLGFRADLIEHFDRLAGQIAGSTAQRAGFIKVAEPWLAGTPPALGSCREDFEVLIAAAGLPQMLARHRERNIPFEITQATAGDLQRRMLEIRERTGRWGLHNLNWIFNHVHRGLLEIGRLQYMPAPYGAPYRIYARKDGREIRAFPEAGRFCSEAGWLERGAIAFETIFRQNGRTIVGNPVDFETGQIRRQSLELIASDFELRLSREIPVWHIHIPSGTSLTPRACLDSMRQAVDLFGKCFPEMSWKAFCCTSWLLDRELGKCLPSDSNIVAFGRMFLPLATPDATSAQLFERVFDDPADWKFQPRTSLQKAIIAHLEKGGTFRNTSGVILRNPLAEPMSGSFYP